MSRPKSEQHYPCLDEAADGWWWVLVQDTVDGDEWCPARIKFSEPKYGQGPSIRISYMRPDGPVGSVRIKEINPADWGGRINPPNV
jgi:hypothetical protein